MVGGSATTVGSSASSRGSSGLQRAMLKVIGTLHRLLYRCSGGRMGTTLWGDPVLLLTTTGRKTGQERTWPICYLSAGDEIVLVASGGGATRHPAWYLNLQANPRVSVRVGERTTTMVARRAEGAERSSLWERFVRRYPVCAAYQRKSGRELPVVILRRETATDTHCARSTRLSSKGIPLVGVGMNEAA
jgi:deazaflavin-dependent oxidoreductase (nitroreductase family)